MTASRRRAIAAKKGNSATLRSASAGTYVTRSNAKPMPKTTVVSVPGFTGAVERWILDRALSEAKSMAVLGSAMASNPEPVSPELARSLQAEENWWRKIEHEFPSLSSTEMAALLGAKATNRNFASSQRAAGKVLGYMRRHAARFPKFQFDLARGTVHSVIPQLIAVSREFGVSDEDLVLWLATPSSLLAEQDRPVDHLDDAERLLAAARDEFGAIW